MARLAPIESRLARLETRLQMLPLVVVGNIATTVVGAASIVFTLMITRSGT